MPSERGCEKHFWRKAKTEEKTRSETKRAERAKNTRESIGVNSRKSLKAENLKVAKDEELKWDEQNSALVQARGVRQRIGSENGERDATFTT